MQNLNIYTRCTRSGDAVYIGTITRTTKSECIKAASKLYAVCAWEFDGVNRMPLANKVAI